MTKPYFLPAPQLKLPFNYLPVFLKVLLSVSFLLVLMQPAMAQHKNYNLLWRISGKGLSKPSYLFGTMHVKDNRAFGFSDSVMLAIKNCQAFALESHPDTLIKKMFETMREKDSTRNIRKLLSKEDYSKLAKRFEDKNGYPMGNVDPMQIESMLKPEKKKADDKKTFVDAYLYGVALTMGKDVYGLENTSQQFDEMFGSKSDLKSKLLDLIDNDDETELDNLEQLIKVYSTGNLENVYSYMGTDQINDDVLIARNKVMVSGMLAHMAGQSLFTAVGVAHLPGDNGIISLLKKAGYTLTPVAANFTGIANSYNADYTKLKWQTYTDSEHGYAIELPFKPIKTNILYGMSTVIYPDYANDIYFGAYAIQKGSSSKPVNENDIIQKVINNFKSNQKNNILSKKPVTLNGLKGTEVIMKTGTAFSRFRLMVDNNYLYCLYAGNDESGINSAYADRFFQSFKSFKTAVKPNAGWIAFKNDTGAFSVNFPFKPTLIQRDIPDPANKTGSSYRIKMYLASDTANLQNYLVRYNDYPPQKFLADQDKAFEGLVAELKTKGELVGDIKTTTKQGYPCREFKMVIAKQYYCVAQLIARGNRIYMIMKQNLQDGSLQQPDDAFFDSFKFIPYIKQELNIHQIDDGAFTASLMPDTKTVVDSVHSSTSSLKTISDTYFTSPASGGLYYLEHAAISKYYRTKSVDSLYNYLASQIADYPDSLIKTDTVIVNGLKGREFITQKNEHKEKTRFRVFIDNSDIFYMSGHMAQEELFSEQSNLFYNSLTKTKDTPPIDLAASKAGLITKDLLAADTGVYKAALGALSYYKFEKEELPYIYKALEQNHTDDTTRKGARTKLIKALTNAHDDKTLEKLTSLYKENGTSDQLKITILGTLADVDKQNGYPLYLDLLTNSPELKSENIYPAFSAMYDSTAYVAANLKRILPLLKYPKYRERVLSVIQQMTYLGEKDKYKPLLKDNFNDIMRYAQTDLDQYLSKTDTINNKWFASGYNYLQLMQYVKNQPLTDKFTSKLIKNDHSESQLSEAVITRIANHLAVDQKLLTRLLDSIGSRYSVMNALNQENQLARVPLKYKKQEEFAKLRLYQSMVDNEDEGVAIQNTAFLGTLPDNGNIYYVLKYQSAYDEEPKAYHLAICGPSKPGSTKLNFDDSYRIYYEGAVKKANWQQQAKAMLLKLKKQIQEERAGKIK